MSKLKRRRKNSSSTHKFESRRVPVREPKLELRRRNAGLTLDRSCCSAELPRHLLGCLKAFLLGWRTVLLSTSWSGVKWLDNEDDKRQEHGSAEEEGRRLRAYGKDCIKDANFDAPRGGFDRFFSLGLFFFGNNVFELLFKVLALTFRSTCKTGGRC